MKKNVIKGIALEEKFKELKKVTNTITFNTITYIIIIIIIMIGGTPTEIYDKKEKEKC